MEKEKKPKCRACRKRGDDPVYLWYQGYLWHGTCVLKISERMQKVIDSPIKTNP